MFLFKHACKVHLLSLKVFYAVIFLVECRICHAVASVIIATQSFACSVIVGFFTKNLIFGGNISVYMPVAHDY